MKVHQAGKGNLAANLLRALLTWTLNMGRRLLILGHYLLACWQQYRLKRAWRRLGQLVHTALAEGEVNPLLTEPVKDALQRANNLKELKERHNKVISDLREKIRLSRVPESAAPTEEQASEEPGQARD
jgi:hypothetical protein